MTRTELYDRITQCLPSGYRYEIGQAVEEIWGQPFDGETERINTAKSASSTSPATEESSATDHFRDATKMVSGESSAPTPTQPKP